jgi:hypothetical protein
VRLAKDRKKRKKRKKRRKLRLKRMNLFAMPEKSRSKKKS